MIGRATGRFTIYRGTTTNDSGDTIDGDYIVASDVVLGLRNATRVEGDPTTAPRTVRYIRGTATPGTDIRAQDRIKDQDSGLRYVVDTVEPGLSSTRNTDLRFDCHRVN